MLSKFIASIHYLKISDAQKLDIGGIIISNPNATIVNNILANGFGEKLGYYGVSKIQKEWAFAFYVINDQISVTDEKDEASLDIASDKADEYMKVMKHLLVTLDTFLWFIKDNSCNVPHILGDMNAGKISGQLTWDYKPIVNNCRGEFGETIFSVSEISAAFEIRKKFFEICPLYREDEDVNEKILNKEKEIIDEIERELNPIERAFKFIRAARNTTDLAAKLAMYMSCFECLFTVSSSEVVQTVSERLAFYIGKDKESKLAIYNSIRLAYDIRSKYIHGASSNKDLRKKSYRINLSQQMDDFARKTLIKVIMSDSDKFMKEDIMAKFLKELIFEDSH